MFHAVLQTEARGTGFVVGEAEGAPWLYAVCVMLCPPTWILGSRGTPVICPRQSFILTSTGSHLPQQSKPLLLRQRNRIYRYFTIKPITVNGDDWPFCRFPDVSDEAFVTRCHPLSSSGTCLQYSAKTNK